MRAIFFKIIMRFFASLPLAWNQALGAGIGKVIAKMDTRLYKTIVRNIHQCYPELSEEEKQTLITQSTKETAKTITEMGPMWWWSQKKLLSCVTQVSGKETLDQAMRSGSGVILAAPHLGAWELVGLYCSSLYPMTSLYRRPRMVALDPIIRKARERAGATLVPTDNQGIKMLLKALKNGEMIAILPDQEPKKGAGIFAEFFHQPAYTMILLSKFVQKTQATVIFGFAERLADGKGYHLHFEPVESAISDSDLSLSVAALNRGVEQCVACCPAQYQWSYKRFRMKPQ